jgi:hypothetical protein
MTPAAAGKEHILPGKHSVLQQCSKTSLNKNTWQSSYVRAEFLCQLKAA